jgi:transposase InsO family protein
MPWKVSDSMSLRIEFVTLASQEGANIAELCRRFEISRKTGYKWIGRFNQYGPGGLQDRSRRPDNSPARTPEDLEDQVIALRDDHPAWGGRKLHARMIHMGRSEVPAPSTITGILRRHGRLDLAESDKHKAWKRFERSAPNSLWQMDFKGHFALSSGRCHPLTVLDDHSRFSLGVQACANERTETVKDRLTQIFKRYGLPDQMLMDNGSPWGHDGRTRFTPLTVWLLHLGINTSHGRPYHPQTQGKDERFHRTLKAEVLRYEHFTDLNQCQRRFDEWREVYNHQRPHEALKMRVPAERYVISSRAFPRRLPPIEYSWADTVRTVGESGLLSYKGRVFRIPKAFKGYPVALRQTATDGVMDVIFCSHTVSKIDLREGPSDE